MMKLLYFILNRVTLIALRIKEFFDYLSKGVQSLFLWIEEEKAASEFHRKLINCAALLGYDLTNTEGICFGFTMRWTEALLLDELERFKKRAQEIVELHDSLLGKTDEERDEILQDYKKKNEEKWWDIKAFYESLLLYQDPSKHKDLFCKKDIVQSDFESVSQIASSDLIQKKNGLKATQSLRYDTFSAEQKQKEGFFAYLNDVAKKIDESNYQQRVVFDLSCYSGLTCQYHAVSLIYDPSTHAWTGMDVNYFLLSKPEQSLEDFYKSMVDNSEEYFPFFSMRAIFAGDQTNFPELNNPSTRFNIENSGINHFLSMAAANGDLDGVQALLEKGADSNKADNSGNTPLLLAANSGHVKVVQALLERGATVDKADNSGNTPLLLAANSGHVKVVQALLEGGATVDKANNSGNTPLLFAANSGHVNVVKALLEREAIVDKANASGETAIFIAAEKGFVDVVKALLDGGGIADKETASGETAIFIAAEKGFVDVVRALLDGGVIADKETASGRTPIFSAAENGRLDVVKALLERGATVDKADILDVTPLMIAAENGFLDVVEALLERGATVDKADNSGNTPLYIASANGDLKVVEALLKEGAQPNIENIFGVTPLSIAEEKGYVEVVEALLKRLAQPNLENHREGEESPLTTASPSEEFRTDEPIVTGVNRVLKSYDLIEMARDVPQADKQEFVHLLEGLNLDFDDKNEEHVVTLENEILNNKMLRFLGDMGFLPKELFSTGQFIINQDMKSALRALQQASSLQYSNTAVEVDQLTSPPICVFSLQSAVPRSEINTSLEELVAHTKSILLERYQAGSSFDEKLHQNIGLLQKSVDGLTQQLIHLKEESQDPSRLQQFQFVKEALSLLQSYQLYLEHPIDPISLVEKQVILSQMTEALEAFSGEAELMAQAKEDSFLAHLNTLVSGQSLIRSADNSRTASASTVVKIGAITHEALSAHPSGLWELLKNEYKVNGCLKPYITANEEKKTITFAPQNIQSAAQTASACTPAMVTTVTDPPPYISSVIEPGKNEEIKDDLLIQAQLMLKVYEKAGSTPLPIRLSKQINKAADLKDFVILHDVFKRFNDEHSGKVVLTIELTGALGEQIMRENKASQSKEFQQILAELEAKEDAAPVVTPSPFALGGSALANPAISAAHLKKSSVFSSDPTLPLSRSVSSDDSLPSSH